ncbi:MAG TPA: NTP transferase domain-containing protein, partial [Phenylobacterium sp.]
MILAILQVRMTSPRLPGKAMEPLRGEPMIWRQVERLRLARTLSKIVVATSDESSDDPLASFLVARGQTVFRGASENLSRRFMRCVEAAGPVSHVVRIKGDSPFVDPAIIDETVRLALSSKAAYASNRVQRTH